MKRGLICVVMNSVVMDCTCISSQVQTEINRNLYKAE